MLLDDAIKELLDAGCDLDGILARVRGTVAMLKGFSEKNLEERNYTYVSVLVQTPGEMNSWTPEAFLVSSPYKAQYKVLAQRYVAIQGWSLAPWSKGHYYMYYPRNYIREATRLFKENKFI